MPPSLFRLAKSPVQTGLNNVADVLNFFLFLFQAGANMIVSGTAVVKSDDPKRVITQLRSGIEKYITALES